MTFDKKMVLCGAAGALTGITVPVGMERFLPQYWNANLIIAGQSWSQRKIVFPLAIGGSLMAVGYFARNKNENFSAFSFVAGAVMAIKAALDLINLFSPSAGLRLNVGQRQRAIVSPIVVVPNQVKPMIPAGVGQENIKFKRNGEKDEGSSRTWVSSKTIIA